MELNARCLLSGLQTVVDTRVAFFSEETGVMGQATGSVAVGFHW